MLHQPRPLARQARRQRAQGIEIEEKVWRLYVNGRRQVAIARQLNLSESRVSRYVARRLQRIEENAPCNPDELVIMREHLAEALWATVAETHPDTREGTCQVTIPATVPMLSVRLKVLDQLARLYGVNSSPQLQSEKHQVYAAPPEIAAAVNERIQALHG
jgi:DNA-binding CsgD family transcriptional regulator